MPDRCADCNARPARNEIVSGFSETFPMRAPEGGRFEITLRLCLECGTRFRDRGQLREHLRAKLPAFVRAAEIVAP